MQIAAKLLRGFWYIFNPILLTLPRTGRPDSFRTCLTFEAHGNTSSKSECGAQRTCDDRLLIRISRCNNDLDGGGDRDAIVDGIMEKGFVIGLGFVEETERFVFKNEGLSNRDASPRTRFEEVGDD